MHPKDGSLCLLTAVQPFHYEYLLLRLAVLYSMAAIDQHFILELGRTFGFALCKTAASLGRDRVEDGNLNRLQYKIPVFSRQRYRIGSVFSENNCRNYIKMNWTTDQIKALAPDSASFAAGQSLAKAGPWKNVGQSDHAIWGDCQGSGKNPYQIRIDQREFAYRCSCPSRKLPCKHTIALLLLAANQPGMVPTATEPDWIAQWLAERDGRTQKKQEKAEAAAQQPVDEKAQTKRAADRQNRVVAGTDQLEHWLSDLVRVGIADLDRKPLSFWDDQSKRLVDAQSPGLASRIQQIGELPGSLKNWPGHVLGEFGRLALLLEAFRKIDTLDRDLQEEIRQQIGWTVDQKSLAETGEKIQDRWILLGQSYELTTKIQTQRNWYYGVGSRRFLLYLQFAVGKPWFEEMLIPGSTTEAEAVFWPGTSRIRGKFLERKNGAKVDKSIGHEESIAEFFDRQAELLSRQPWIDRVPALLKNIVVLPPQNENGLWTIQDEQSVLPLVGTNHWTLLAVSGGNPVSIFGEWNGRTLTPLSVMGDARNLSLETGGKDGRFFTLNSPSGQFSGTTPSTPVHTPTFNLNSPSSCFQPPALLKQSLLGTDKTVPSSSGDENAGQIDSIDRICEGNDKWSVAWKLLLRAGCYAVAEQVGFEPETVCETYSLPQLPESRPAISPRLTECLKKLLKEFSDSPQVSIHVLNRVDNVNLRFSAETLPDLLSAFSQRRMFKEDAHAMILALIGQRGRWLATKNPDWYWASDQPIDEKNGNSTELESIWNEGTFRGRESALKTIAKIDAAKAKQLLAETWKNEKAEHREAFLNTLSRQFDDGDVLFLEEILKDRSGSIRQTAATFLAQLPESNYAARTLERAEEILVAGTKPNTLCIKPPTEFTKTMKADALEEKPPRGVGEKAWWTSESLRRVPLTHWEKRFQMGPREILAVIAKDDYFHSALYAWTYTVQWFSDHDHWLEPLWDTWNAVKSVPEAIDSREVLIKFALARFPLRFWEKLKNLKQGVQNYSYHLQTAWLELAQHMPEPWDEHFVASLIEYFESSLNALLLLGPFIPFFPAKERPRLRTLIRNCENREQQSNYLSSAIMKCNTLLDLCEEIDRLLEQETCGI